MFKRFMPVTSDYRGDRFFVREKGVLMATPLFVVLLLIEFTDLVFAVDSGGLLRIDILRKGGRATVIPPLDVGTQGASFSASGPEELLDLEKRFARVSPVLSQAQQARGDALFRTVRGIRDEDCYPGGVESLEQMVAEMERVIR